MFKHIAWAMQAQTPDALSRWLLVVLADHADEKNICWPSQSTLASRTGMNRATVNRKLLLLEESGLISRQSGFKGKSTVYCLHPVAQSDTPVAVCDTPVAQSDTKLPVNYKTLSEEWAPSDELKAKLDVIANKEGVNIDHGIEAIKFTSHHISKGTKLRNIEQAYRKWFANAVSYSKRDSAGASGGQRKQSGGNKQDGSLRRFIDSARA